MVEGLEAERSDHRYPVSTRLPQHRITRQASDIAVEILASFGDLKSCILRACPLRFGALI